VDEVEFEVRSIQEFFAAKAIVSGSDDSVIDRLQKTMTPVHWRNTWLLAAGRVFAQREHIRLNIVGLLNEIDTAEMMNVVVAPGADLALDLLDDDLTATTPRFQRMFAERALTLLSRPPDQDLDRRALILFQNAARDAVIRASAEKAIEQALQATPAQVRSAEIVQRVWKEQEARLVFASGKQPARPEPGPAAQKAKPTRPMQDRTIADLVRGIIEETDMTPLERETADGLLGALATVPVLPDDVRPDETSVLASDRVVSRSMKDACFSTAAISDAVAKATIEAGKLTWVGASELRNMMRVWLQRQPVGDYILTITPFTED
jgi:hypothetical protein